MIRSVAAGDRRIPVRVTPAGAQTFALFPSIGEYLAYDDQVYETFAATGRRNSAYRAALAACCPGHTVADIGTGRDALWAIAAARAGARRVYAIEALPQVAALARDAVQRARVADVVRVVEGRSEDVDLPEPIDVASGEVIGNIASAEGALSVLGDARRRWCHPLATCIPFRCRTRVAATSLYALDPDGCAIAQEALPYVERVFAQVGRAFDLRLCVAGPVHDTLISSTRTVETLRFDRADAVGDPDTESAVETELTVRSRAALTGFVLWPEVQCGPGEGLIDGLAPSERGWAPVFVPISRSGVDVRPGDVLRVRFHRSLSDDGVHPNYQLTADVLRDGRPGRLGQWHSSHHRQGFRQSGFYRWLFPGAGT